MHHILGVGLTDHPHRMPIERPFDVSSELLEGARVPPTGPLHKQSARLGGDPLHEGALAASIPVR